MAYVYGARKRRQVVASAPEPAAEEVPVEVPAEPNRGRVTGRKRGQGKNNKHGNGCGTNNGWAAHKRAGEDVCDPCNWAHREYKNACAREARARKQVAA